MPWTREDWNDILRRINDLSANPDPGCEALPPLEEVPEKHIWRKSDIEAVRDRLLAICENNTFTAELRLWSQGVIDEIEAAIEQGWCGCDEVCEDPVIYLLPTLEEENEHPYHPNTLFNYWPYLGQNYDQGVPTDCFEGTLDAREHYLTLDEDVQIYGPAPDPGLHTSETKYLRYLAVFQVFEPYAPDWVCIGTTVDLDEQVIVARELATDGRLSSSLPTWPAVVGRAIRYVGRFIGADFTWFELPVHFELRALCVEVRLTNYSIPRDSPIGTPIAELLWTDERFQAFLGFSEDVVLEGGVLHTLREFDEHETHIDISVWVERYELDQHNPSIGQSARAGFRIHLTEPEP